MMILTTTGSSAAGLAELAGLAGLIGAKDRPSSPSPGGVQMDSLLGKGRTPEGEG